MEKKDASLVFHTPRFIEVRKPTGKALVSHRRTGRECGRLRRMFPHAENIRAVRGVCPCCDGENALYSFILGDQLMRMHWCSSCGHSAHVSKSEHRREDRSMKIVRNRRVKKDGTPARKPGRGAHKPGRATRRRGRLG